MRGVALATPTKSRVWSLLPLLTDDELRELLTQVRQELAARHGDEGSVPADVLMEDEAQLLALHRSSDEAGQSSLESSRAS